MNLPLTEEDLERLRHRGPDDFGLESFDVGAHRLTLGHRRLSIVDLSEAGHQPMHSADGASVLAFNGEIYNHQVLRGRCEQSAWRGHSDTETIVELLTERGIDGVAELNGIFAFAWYDSRDRCLYLARDPFGVKPLYYARDGERLVFGSELAPIRALVGSELDPQALAMLLRLRYLPSPYTLYAGIRKVRPGHYLKVDLDGPPTLSEHLYVDDAVDRLDLSYRDAVDAYGVAFERAVQRQLMSDVEIGVLLSGGVDSALVSHFAQRHQVKPVKAFCVGFEGAHAEDEIDDARRSADAIGMDFHHRRVGVDDFLQTLEQVVGIVEEPVATTSIVPMFFLSELASSHVKVVLSGQGADEPLGGYGRYRGALIFDRVPRRAARWAGRLLRGAGVRNETLLRGTRAASERDEIRRILATWQTFTEDEIRGLTGAADVLSEPLLRENHRQLHCDELPGTAERLMRLDLRMGLADDLLHYTDKITMRHSLECRVPILDHDLVRFIEGLPTRYRVGLRHQKRIHKDFAARVLPAEIVGRPKKGFQSPTAAWFRKSARVRELFHDHRAVLDGVLDLDAIDAVLEQHDAGFNREKQIFLLLAILFTLK